MTFTEALRSGQPFRQPDWLFWIWHDPQRGFMVAEHDVSRDGPGTFSDYWAFGGRSGEIPAMLNDQWEIHGSPEPLESWIDMYHLG